jgi:hypothetical protein
MLTAPALADDWSPTVDGLRGRLVVTPASDAGHRAQLRIELELENTSDRADPLAFVAGNPSQVIELTLEDEAGKRIERAGVGGNELTIPAYTLQLPVASTLRMTLSPAAYEYAPRGVMLRPFSFQAWDLPAKHGKLYLRAKFKPLAGKLDSRHAWKGELALPRVALP